MTLLDMRCCRRLAEPKPALREAHNSRYSLLSKNFYVRKHTDFIKYYLFLKWWRKAFSRLER